MRYRIRALLAVTSVVALLAAVIGMAVRSAERTYDGIRDYYAIDHTQMMITDFVRAHQGDWPSSWKDLGKYYTKYQDYGWTNDFEAHRELVRIDFAFDPKEYFEQHPEADLDPLRLVTVTSFRSDTGWDALDDVNRRLIATLRSMHIADQP